LYHNNKKLLEKEEKMGITEITAAELNPKDFIQEKIADIKNTVGDGKAINALSGGVDSSAVAMLGHRALGKKMINVFIDNGLMRKNEARTIVDIFVQQGVDIIVIDAANEFLEALKGIEDPEEKRGAVVDTFYKKVFARLIKRNKATCLFQGTILTDIDETVAGIKRQHNVFEQLGIDPKKEFGYQIVEPLVQLRKDGVRMVAKALGLPESIYNRPPFPGPALATRIVGPVTKEKVELVREATVIVEEALLPHGPFQVMAILQSGKVTGMVNNERRFGYELEIRCWDSVDARTAEPMRIPYDDLFGLGKNIPAMIPEIVNVTYGLTPKPPVTLEAV
jgi:GMP synthase (glutamine-hydrolysing)